MPKLSKRTIDAFKPSDRDTFHWDSEIKGFGVRVFPSGQKTYLVQYRHAGRTRRVKLGRVSQLTPDEARKEAQRVLGEFARGDDPAERIAVYRKAPTVAAACDRFLQEHVSERCKPRTQEEYRRAVERFIKPAFGTRKVADITRPDIAELHHKHRATPYQSNRTLGVLSKMFNLCEMWGLRPDGSNPCRHVAKYPERKKERFLLPHEIARLAQTLDTLEAEGSETVFICGAFRLLMLTGCRLREVQTLQWAFIDANYFNLPDTKTGARRVPIGPDVHDALSRIPRMAGNPYVISGKVEGEFATDLQKPWRRIRTYAGLEDVRIHDLRHTFASAAIGAGQPVEVVMRLLGHTQLQTTMRYAHLADSHVREAVATVSGSIGGLMERRSEGATPALGGGNIVPLRR